MAFRVLSLLVQLWFGIGGQIDLFETALGTDERGNFFALIQVAAQGVTASDVAGASKQLSGVSAASPRTAASNATAVAVTAAGNAAAVAHAATEQVLVRRTISRRALNKEREIKELVDLLKESSIALGISASTLAMLIAPLALMLGYCLWRHYGEGGQPDGVQKVASKTSLNGDSVLSIEEAIEQVGIGRTQWILLILCGLTFTSDAAEITFLSFVTEVLRCDWGLTKTQEAAISSAVFVGMLVGCPVWGWVADNVGRRKAFLCSSMVITTFGFATALAPNVECLMIVRALVGVGVAGLPVGFDILAEALPAKGRGTFLLYIEFFWTVGSIYVVVCANLSLQSSIGWKLLTVLSALPTLVATIMAFVCLPESPRWLVEEGRFEEALTIINSWARSNGSLVRIKELKEHPHEHGDAGSADTNNVWRSMRLMSVVWFCFGVTYYGIVLLIPRLFEAGAAGEDAAMGCSVTFDYKDIATSSCGEVLGVILALLLIESAGRCPTQAGTYGIASLLFTCLAFHGIDAKVLLAIASCVRLCLMAGSCATWVHTPELFPTHHRAEAHHMCNLMSKVGAACAPFLVGGAFSSSVTAGILSAVALTASTMALCLPETAGKEI